MEFSLTTIETEIDRIRRYAIRKAAAVHEWAILVAIRSPPARTDARRLPVASKLVHGIAIEGKTAQFNEFHARRLQLTHQVRLVATKLRR